MKDKLPNEIDILYQDALNDFMGGKYQIAYENLKKVRLMMKGKLKDNQP